MMAIIGWLIIGALAGLIAGKLMGGGGQGLIGDIIVGLLGAVIGGFLASWLFNIDIMNGQDWWITLIVSVVGAAILIGVLRAITGRNRATTA